MLNEVFSPKIDFLGYVVEAVDAVVLKVFCNFLYVLPLLTCERQGDIVPPRRGGDPLTHQVMKGTVLDCPVGAAHFAAVNVEKAGVRVRDGVGQSTGLGKP